MERWWDQSNVIDRFLELLSAKGATHYAADPAKQSVWLGRFLRKWGMRRWGPNSFIRRECSDGDARDRVLKTWRGYDRLVAHVRSMLSPREKLVLVNFDETFLRFKSEATGRVLPTGLLPTQTSLRNSVASKAGCTALCFVSSDAGFSLRPHVVFGKYDPSAEWKSRARAAAGGGVEFHMEGNGKGSHWLDKTLFKSVLQSVIRQKRALELKSREIYRVIMMCDGVNVHNYDEKMERELENASIHTLTFEPGISHLVQPCDVGGLFRTLKHYCRKRHALDFNLGDAAFMETFLEFVHVDYSNLRSFEECGFGMGRDQRGALQADGTRRVHSRLQTLLGENGHL